MYYGMVISSYIILLLNGFVGFQWAEDGTATSLWVTIYIKYYIKYKELII